MMSGHGTNPVFFNKKIKIGRLEHSLLPSYVRQHLIFALPPPPPTHSSKCVSSLIGLLIWLSISFFYLK